MKNEKTTVIVTGASRGLGAAISAITMIRISWMLEWSCSVDSKFNSKYDGHTVENL